MRLLSEIRNYMGNYHLKSGVYHYYRNEYRQAVGFLQKALAEETLLSDGDRASAHGYLARACKGLGEKLAAEGAVEAGIEQLQAAVEIDGSYPDIHFRLAELLRSNDRPLDAVDAYRRAIACHPEYLDAQVALGDCLIDVGRNEDAAEVYRRALELSVARVERPFLQAMKRLAEGRPEVAREWFHEAFLAAPRLSKAYLQEALEWMRNEDHERSLDSLDRALELSPKYPDLHNFRGIVLCELEQYEEAFDSFRKSIELRPDHLVPCLNLAFAFLRAGRVADGERELMAILEREPEQHVAASKLAELRSSRVAEKPGAGAGS